MVRRSPAEAVAHVGTDRAGPPTPQRAGHRQSASRSASVGAAGVVDVDDERASVGPGRPQPGLERVHDRASSANTSGWSHSALSTTAMSGRYASKLPAYSSASTTNASPLPQRAVAGSAAGQRRGQQRAHEGRRVAPAATSTWTSQPAEVDLPCVPATRHEPAALGRRGVRDDLLPRLQRDARPARAATSSGMVGRDRRERLGHRQPAGPAASRLVTCAGSWRGQTSMPAPRCAAV